MWQVEWLIYILVELHTGSITFDINFLEIFLLQRDCTFQLCLSSRGWGGRGIKLNAVIIFPGSMSIERN